MMSFALVCAVLGAEPVRGATGPFSYVGVDPALGELLVEQVVGIFSEHGLAITTPKDVQAVLGLERQRQLLGCQDESASCMAELAGALGADVMLLGSFARTPQLFLVNLKFVAAADGTTVVALSTSLKNEAELGSWLEGQAEATTQRVSDVLLARKEKRRPPSPMSPVWRWAPGALGVVAAGLGAGFFIDSVNQRSRIRALQGASAEVVAAAQQQGQFSQNLGVGLLVAGGALVATTVVWVLVHWLSGDSPAPVAWSAPSPTVLTWGLLP